MESANESKGTDNYYILKIGTWNVRSIMDKEKELEEEFEKADLDILGITETKKKGTGEIVLDSGHLFIYSGVQHSNRAREGVGCIIKKDKAKHIYKWKGITARLLHVELDIGEQSKTSILVVYGPDENEAVKIKDEFWEKLTEEIEEIKGRLLIIGDLNGRVGKRNQESGETIGTYGETTLNNNGRRLVDFCLLNNLIITNTFYAHKDIHKYTREVRSRGERSIIDYIIIDRYHRKEIMDTRVYRGSEIYSDHYLVMSKMKVPAEQYKAIRAIGNAGKLCIQKVKTYKLKEEEFAREYTSRTETEMRKIKEVLGEASIEEIWERMKESMIKTAREVCGEVKIRGNKKQTRWWSEELKNEIKNKKLRWKEYLGSREKEKFNTYKQQRNKVKQMVKEAKQKAWEEFGETMERDAVGNQKLFYKVLKTIRKGKAQKITHIKTKEGRIVSEEEDILKRWKEYFEEMLTIDQSIISIEEDQHVEDEDNNEESGIKLEEVMEAVKRLKRGKAVGHDGVSTEMVKNLGREGMEVVTALYNKVWLEEQIPKDWEIGILMPIYKKGDKRDCTNYRGITMTCILAKVYERILGKRLEEKTETQLEESQCGFRKGRGVQDHIFMLKQLIEKYTRETIFVAFIDLEKAFDSIPRRLVWSSLKRRGIGNKLGKCIRSMYTNTRNYVRTGNYQSEEFTTKEGLRQGGVLSPALFNVVMDDIIKEVKGKTRKLNVGYRNLVTVELAESAFADDLMIFAKNERDLQNNLDIWSKALKDRNLRINVKKTKVMAIGNDNINMTILIYGKSIEQVDTFKYLGVKIQKNGKIDAELSDRLTAATNLYYSLNRSFIRNKLISRKTKIRVYKTIFKPTIVYGCESWVVTNQASSKIQAIEMKYLRGVMGITRLDRCKNDIVRRELEVEPIIESIKRQQLKWFGHLMRMGEGRKTKNVWQARPWQKRKRGRPRKTWDNEILENLREKGLSWSEGKTLAKDKKRMGQDDI
uniref:Reverse transcriptase domain-containing protein n=1 Tax=Photinus pyralis TaxID=7054 RepID=A0A1Y1M3Z3_PHOPY